MKPLPTLPSRDRLPIDWHSLASRRRWDRRPPSLQGQRTRDVQTTTTRLYYMGVVGVFILWTTIIVLAWMVTP